MHIQDLEKAHRLAETLKGARRDRSRLWDRWRKFTEMAPHQQQVFLSFPGDPDPCGGDQRSNIEIPMTYDIFHLVERTMQDQIDGLVNELFGMGVDAVIAEDNEYET